MTDGNDRSGAVPCELCGILEMRWTMFLAKGGAGAGAPGIGGNYPVVISMQTLSAGRAARVPAKGYGLHRAVHLGHSEMHIYPKTSHNSQSSHQVDLRIHVHTYGFLPLRRPAALLTAHRRLRCTLSPNARSHPWQAVHGCSVRRS